MNLLTAYQRLEKLSPVFFTKDAAVALEVNNTHAAIILSKLEKNNAIVRLMRGCFAYSHAIDPLLLPNKLASPMMAYVSLQSALYYRGMIDQIPNTVYAITNGKTKIFHTPLASVSLHSINPKLFTGYEMIGKSCILMATAEKALFDTLYLMPAKSHLFKTLTEIEFPDHFDFSLFTPWLKKIRNISRRVMIENAMRV